MNDLISREALKKALDEQMNFEENCRDSVFDIIDNAPTVIIDWEKSDAYLDCIKRIKSLEKENDELRQFLRANFERPQGEWKLVAKPGLTCIYQCSLCGRTISTTPMFLADYPFCHCGADMRKGGAE